MTAEEQQQKEISDLRQRLAESTGRIERLEAEKRDLQVKLDGAEVTINEFRGLRKASVESAEKMSSSTIFLGLYSEGFEKEPVPLMQLALAILMDKPLVIIADNDRPISKTLSKIATSIERVPPGDHEAYHAAVKRGLDVGMKAAGRTT